MRHDKNQDKTFTHSYVWHEESVGLNFFEPTEEGSPYKYRLNGLSGGERNRLLLQGQKEEWVDLCLISGIDYRSDGRGHALLDFDHDGWLDIALISPQNPRLRLLRNQLGDLGLDQHFLSIELIAGESNPDAVGTEILVESRGVTRRFQRELGAGLSSQNTKRIHIGMGNTTSLDRLTVRWPSGKEQVLENVKANPHLQIREP